MRIPGHRRPGRLDSTVATGELNRKPFLRHRKAMGIFESTNGGRLAHSGGRSPVDRTAWQQPMNFVTLRAIELLDCPRSLFSSSGSLAMLAAIFLASSLVMRFAAAHLCRAPTRSRHTPPQNDCVADDTGDPAIFLDGPRLGSGARAWERLYTPPGAGRSPGKIDVRVLACNAAAHAG